MDEEKMWRAALSLTAGWLWKRVKSLFKKKPLPFEEIKRQANILVIDDEPLDGLLTGIRTSGWNINQVKDIDNLDAEVLKKADIIFVDYKNVGTILTASEEGVGLLKLLKRKYPNKHFIFFSGYAGFIPGYEVHNMADGWIQKHSDLHIYIERIEIAAQKVYANR